MQSERSGPSWLPSAAHSAEIDPDRDLAGALHDVSNALTVVQGWLERARGLLEPGTEAHRAVEVAWERACSGRQIARRAIGAEVEDLPEEDLLRELVSDTLTGVLPEASAKQIRLVVCGLEGQEHQGVRVHKPPVLLQVLTNLLLNAIAFSPESGAVTVAVQVAGEDDVLFRVLDEGPGVSLERQDTLFRRGRSTRRGGAGIGLGYARALACRYGGDLTLESTEQRGSCFALSWPQAHEALTRVLRRTQGALLGGKRILVVEDDGAVVILLETALASRGAEVVCAQNMQEFEAALCRGVFYAALIDLSPFGAHVESCLASLQQSNPEMRLVIISGSTLPLPASALAEGVTWVRKPFDLSEVLGALAEPDSKPA